MQGLSTKTITALFQDRIGFLWLGTQDGLFRYEGSRTRRFSLEQGVPGGYVLQFGEAPDGTLWVATSLGIARLSGERFLPLQLRGVELRNTSQTFAFDAKGRMHFGGTRGLVTLSSATSRGSCLSRPRFPTRRSRGFSWIRPGRSGCGR